MKNLVRIVGVLAEIRPEIWYASQNRYHLSQYAS
jgi:hypothetical protein